MEFVEANRKSIEGKEEISRLTAKEFFKYRKLNFGVEAIIVAIEYVVGISYDENVFASQLLKQVHNYFCKHLILINDLYSFKKEFVTNGAPDNYVTAISRRLNCTIEKALNIVLKELAQCENDFCKCVTAFKSSDLHFFDDCLIALENFLFESTQFHKSSIRYQQTAVNPEEYL
jgi:hypothetical protein